MFVSHGPLRVTLNSRFLLSHLLFSWCESWKHVFFWGQNPHLINSFVPFQGYYCTSPYYITHRSETVSYLSICICVQIQVRCADPTSYISEHSSKIQHRSTTKKIKVVLIVRSPSSTSVSRLWHCNGKGYAMLPVVKILHGVACKSCAAVEWENHKSWGRMEWKG